MMELNKHRAVILLMMLYAQFCKMQLLAAHLYTVLLNADPASPVAFLGENARKREVY